ncbi:MAG: Ltp family lipoprotein [Clostridia bacterium]|nr:Ltp family lipoprotein [Clostridia bacterium]
MKNNEKEPYVPISEDQADNTYLEEFEAEMAGTQQGQPPEQAQQPTGTAPQAPVPPVPPEQEKKPVYKQWWFWLIIAVVLIAAIVTIILVGKSSKSKTSTSASSSTSASTSQTTSQTTSATTTATTTQTTTAKKTTAATTEDEDDKESRYQYALQKAKFLSDTAHMSKQAIYNELVSPGGENLKKDAAQYAVDKLGSVFNANALVKAKEYDEEGMSGEEIKNRLIDGDLFTEDEAEYAVDHLGN